MLRMREGCQQAADLGGGHGDEVAYVVAAMVIMPQACPGKLSTAAGAPFELRRPEGRQARAWTVWRAGTRRRSGGPGSGPGRSRSWRPGSIPRPPTGLRPRRRVAPRWCHESAAEANMCRRPCTSAGYEVLPSGVVVVHLDEFDARRGRDAYFLSNRGDLFLGELLESLASRPNICDLDPLIGRDHIVEQQAGGGVWAPGSDSQLSDGFVVLIESGTAELLLNDDRHDGAP